MIEVTTSNREVLTLHYSPYYYRSTSVNVPILKERLTGRYKEVKYRDGSPTIYIEYMCKKRSEIVDTITESKLIFFKRDKEVVKIVEEDIPVWIPEWQIYFKEIEEPIITIYKCGEKLR